MADIIIQQHLNEQNINTDFVGQPTNQHPMNQQKTKAGCATQTQEMEQMEYLADSMEGNPIESVKRDLVNNT